MSRKALADGARSLISTVILQNVCVHTKWQPHFSSCFSLFGNKNPKQSFNFEQCFIIGLKLPNDWSEGPVLTKKYSCVSSMLGNAGTRKLNKKGFL